MSLDDAKVLGGLGSVLLLLGVVPNIGWLLGLAGIVMIILAVRDISKAVNEGKIYCNMKSAILFAAGAIGVGIVTVAGAAYSLLAKGVFGGHFTGPNVLVADWTGLAVIGGLLALWALLVTSAVFVRRSFSSISSKLDIKRFQSAGLIFLVGVATTVIGVGFILIFIAEILLAISFFSIREQQWTPKVAGTPRNQLGA